MADAQSVTITTPPTGPNAPAPANNAPQRPEHVPEKFWDAEKGAVKVDDLAKSYGELEKKFSTQPKPQDQKPVDGDAKPADGDQKPQDQSQPKVNPSLQPFSEEFAKDGKLSDESYTKLSEMGYPKEMVDAYIAGQQARGQAHAAALMEPVGGAEVYQQMVAWAAQNLQPNEIEQYNKALQGEGASFAIQGLHARYKEAVGNEPSLLKTENGNNDATNVYRSVAEMTRDMQDPRYKKDAAFRKDVEAKTQRSNLFGRSIVAKGRR